MDAYLDEYTEAEFLGLKRTVKPFADDYLDTPLLGPLLDEKSS